MSAGGYSPRPAGRRFDAAIFAGSRTKRNTNQHLGYDRYIPARSAHRRNNPRLCITLPRRTIRRLRERAVAAPPGSRGSTFSGAIVEAVEQADGAHRRLCFNARQHLSVIMLNHTLLRSMLSGREAVEALDAMARAGSELAVLIRDPNAAPAPPGDNHSPPGHSRAPVP